MKTNRERLIDTHAKMIEQLDSLVACQVVTVDMQAARKALCDDIKTICEAILACPSGAIGFTKQEASGG